MVGGGIQLEVGLVGEEPSRVVGSFKGVGLLEGSRILRGRDKGRFCFPGHRSEGWRGHVGDDFGWILEVTTGHLLVALEPVNGGRVPVATFVCRW